MSHILLADDDSYLLQGQKRLLRRMEPAWAVSTAQSLKEALRIAQEQHVDAVVSDVHMPGVDGLKLVHALRRSARYRSTPIILLSGSGDDLVYDMGRALGATDVLTKPCPVDILISRLRSMVGTGRAPVEDGFAEDCRARLASAA